MRRVEAPAKVFGIYCGRHYDYAEIGSHKVPRLKGKCQCQVGREAAFMEFVENYSRHAIESRIVDEYSLQYTLGEDFDAGCIGNA